MTGMVARLRRKFILAAMLATFLVLSITLGSILLMNYQRIAADADSLLQVMAENGGRFPLRQPPDGKGAPGEPGRWPFSPERPYESRYFTVAADSGGTVLWVDTGRIAAVDSGEAARYAQTALEKGRTAGFLSQYRYLVADQEGGWRLVIFLDCGRELSNFSSFLFSSGVVSALGLGAVLVLLLLFSGLFLRPVVESDRKQRQFITDAGHELKTPLTIIDANTEVLEMEGGENEWTRGIRGQVRRLASLTADLIALSRMEEEQTLNRREVCLSRLAAQTAEPFEGLARAQGKTFETAIAPDLLYKGDEKLLERLLTALLDNSVKYCPPGGTIRLTLDRPGRRCCLTLRNTARGLPPGELPQLFDRFYRADGSRNSQTGGHGIGLSVAKAIADAHKGSIRAQSDGESLTVTLLL